MKSRRRTLAFDSLEHLMLLSTIHPAVGHASAQQGQLPAFVRAVERAAKQSHGTHITVVPILAAPGSLTEYQVTFQIKGQTYTTDITVPYHGPKYGPQPG